jgi:hypothetical protein
LSVPDNGNGQHGCKLHLETTPRRISLATPGTPFFRQRFDQSCLQGANLSLLQYRDTVADRGPLSKNGFSGKQ